MRRTDSRLLEFNFKYMRRGWFTESPEDTIYNYVVPSLGG